MNQNAELFQAVKFRDLDRVVALLDQGAEINVRNSVGDTPLLSAIFYGYEEMAWAFIKRGADINQKDSYGSIPLIEAIGNGWITLAWMLIKRGAEIDVQNRWGNTPLTLAIACGYESLAKVLVTHGADVNQRSRSPLMLAIKNNFEELAMMLIVKGADVNQRCSGRFGYAYPDPLRLAIEKRLGHIASELIDRDAYSGLNIGDNPPLLLAIEKGLEDVACKLLVRTFFSGGISFEENILPVMRAIDKGLEDVTSKFVAHHPQLVIQCLHQLLDGCIKQSLDPGPIDTLKRLLNLPEMTEISINRKVALRLAAALNTSLDATERKQLVSNVFIKKIKKEENKIPWYNILGRIVQWIRGESNKTEEVLLDKIPLYRLFDYSVGIISARYYLSLREMLKQLLCGEVAGLSVTLEKLNDYAANHEDYVPLPYTLEFIAQLQVMYELDSGSFCKELMDTLTRVGVFEKEDTYTPVEPDYRVVRKQIAAIIAYAEEVVRSQPSCEEQGNPLVKEQAVPTKIHKPYVAKPVPTPVVFATFSLLNCVTAGLVGLAVCTLVVTLSFSSFGIVPAVVVGGTSGLFASGLTLYSFGKESNEEAGLRVYI